MPVAPPQSLHAATQGRRRQGVAARPPAAPRFARGVASGAPTGVPPPAASSSSSTNSDATVAASASAARIAQSGRPAAVTTAAATSASTRFPPKPSASVERARPKSLVASVRTPHPTSSQPQPSPASAAIAASAIGPSERPIQPPPDSVTDMRPDMLPGTEPALRPNPSTSRAQIDEAFAKMGVSELTVRMLSLFELDTVDWQTLACTETKADTVDVAERLVALGNSYVNGKSATLSTSAASTASQPNLNHASCSDDDHFGVAPDLLSACLYASLAYALMPHSTRVLHLISTVLLRGVAPTPFPFSPSPTQLAAPAPASAWSPLLPELPVSAAPLSRAGAHQTLHILDGGPSDVFEDQGLARVYAAACRALGRYREAMKATEWSLAETQRRGQRATQLAGIDGKANGAARGQAGSSTAAAPMGRGVTRVASSEMPAPDIRAGLRREVADHGTRGESSWGASPRQPLHRDGNLTVEKRSPVQDHLLASQARDRLELGWLAWKAKDTNLAHKHFAEVGRLDPWNWSHWVSMCDMTPEKADEGSGPGTSRNQFSPERILHDARELFPRLFRERLCAAGIEIVATADGAFSFELSEELAQNLGGATAVQGAKAGQVSEGGGEPRSRSTSKAVKDESQTLERRPVGPVRGKPAASVAKNSQSGEAGQIRPGSRTTPANVPGSLTGSKRARTGQPVSSSAPNGTSQMGGAARHAGSQASGVSAPAPKTRGATLGTARTNEQYRPSSSASGTSRGTTMEKDDGKPQPAVRRVTRAAASNVDRPPGSRIVPARSTSASMRATRSAQAAQANGTAHPARAALTGPNGAAASSTTGNGSASARRPESGPARADLKSATTEADPHRQAGSRFNAQVASRVQEIASGAAVAAAAEASRQAARWTSVDRCIMRLVRRLAHAYRAARLFQGAKVQWLLRSDTRPTADSAHTAVEPASCEGETPLPTWLRDSPYVRCLLGRACHDMGDYARSEEHFVAARARMPHLVAGMDIYSLTLFQLQREAELSQLAADLSYTDPTSCAAAIAVGNAFSLHRDHLSALREFRRAALVAPDYAYAYTLAGYEASDLDQADKALAFWRRALRCDRRHWNAWVGIGGIYLNAEKYVEARVAYENAARINGGNAHVHGLVGRASAHLDDNHRAIAAFEAAVRLDPESISSRIHLASLLVKTNEFARAHEELLEIVKMAPQEAAVHLELAKSYMRIGGGQFALTERSRHGAAAAAAATAAGMEATARIRARGESKLPQAYHSEIAHHLSVAIHLNPHLGREIKAMGEGVRATLRGVASRLGRLTGARGAAAAAAAADYEAYLLAGERSIAETSFEATLEDQVYEDEPSHSLLGASQVDLSHMPLDFELPRGRLEDSHGHGHGTTGDGTSVEETSVEQGYAGDVRSRAISQRDLASITTATDPAGSIVGGLPRPGRISARSSMELGGGEEGGAAGLSYEAQDGGRGGDEEEEEDAENAEVALLGTPSRASAAAAAAAAGGGRDVETRRGDREPAPRRIAREGPMGVDEDSEMALG